ncbi:MAG: hypothetical protein IPL90_01235 [Holophagales bacterium]|nr:hypothetical protein [Holophagales bacterium]
MTLTVTNASGQGSTTRNVAVTAGAASPVTLQVPVVLDVFGVAPTHYTSDLIAVNRGFARRASRSATSPPPEHPEPAARASASRSRPDRPFVSRTSSRGCARTDTRSPRAAPRWSERSG